MVYDILYVCNRAALEDIKVELQERTQRWKKIEKICGFNIITNPGIPYLDSLLRGSSISLVSGQRFYLFSSAFITFFLPQMYKA